MTIKSSICDYSKSCLKVIAYQGEVLEALSSMIYNTYLYVICLRGVYFVNVIYKKKFSKEITSKVNVLNQNLFVIEFKNEFLSCKILIVLTFVNIGCL